MWLRQRRRATNNGERNMTTDRSVPAPPHDVGNTSPGGNHGGDANQAVPGGVVHQLPTDLRNALIGNTTALDAWNDITPLARNEFICWVEDAKQEQTRQRRICRAQQELEQGQRRPCC